MSKTLGEMQAAHNRDSAWGNLLRMGLLMGGIGVGARGLKGLLGLGRRNLAGSERLSLLGNRTVDVPVEDEEEKYAHVKMAEGSWHSWLTDPFVNALKGNTSTPMAQPWVLPAAVIGGPLAAYGGYKLTDKLLDSRRKDEQEARLEKAKKEYEEALKGHGKVGEDLDRLCGLMEKEALNSTDWAGIGVGGAATLAGLLALGSGMFAYDMSKKKRPDEVLRAAKRRRDRERMRRTPPPIFARVGGAPNEDELAGEPLDKVAMAAAPGGPKPPPPPEPPPAPKPPSPPPEIPLGK